MQVFLRLFNRMGWNGHDQTAVLHAFQANQPVSELGDGGGLAVHDEDFEAGVVVEVGVACGDDELVAGVLQLGEFFADSPGVVVVDNGDGAHHGGCVVGGPLGYQAVSDEIAEGLGSVGIAQPRDEIIEAFEEVRIECNSDSAKDAHGHSLEENYLRPGKLENSTITNFVARLSISNTNPGTAL
jgi:hypothetical protein